MTRDDDRELHRQIREALASREEEAAVLPEDEDELDEDAIDRVLARLRTRLADRPRRHSRPMAQPAVPAPPLPPDRFEDPAMSRPQQGLDVPRPMPNARRSRGARDGQRAEPSEEISAREDAPNERPDYARKRGHGGNGHPSGC